jgi:cytochrome d ubiquinol oxidase subunit I
VLFNSTAIYAFLHTLLAAALTAGMVVIAVSAWQVRGQNDHAAGASVLRLAMPIVAVAALLQIGVGHFDGQLMAKQQPMKMAAADAVFSSGPSKGLSLFATGDFASNPKGLNRNIEIPKLLSFISTGYPNGTIQGINNLNAQYRKRYGPGQYAPIVAVTYWTWRAMIACGMLMLLIGAYGWWRVRRGSLTDSPRFLRWLVPAAALPFLASLTGWTFTEMGRQPWAVFGLLKTSASNSPTVSAADVWITLVGFTLLYGVLALFAGRLFLKTVRRGAPDAPEPVDGSPDFVLTY